MFFAYYVLFKRIKIKTTTRGGKLVWFAAGKLNVELLVIVVLSSSIAIFPGDA